MVEKTKSCVLVIDMINDFVSGKFGNNNAGESVKLAEIALKQLKGKLPIIFANDSHIKDDPEFMVWGEHAVDGTWGSEIVEQLVPFPDYVIKKRHYDAFSGTDLDSLMRALGINNIYIFGISTDICVEHTCAGAFYRYYNVKVVSDLCACIDQLRQANAINNIKINYGYIDIKSEELLKEVYK